MRRPAAIDGAIVLAAGAVLHAFVAVAQAQSIGPAAPSENLLQQQRTIDQQRDEQRRRDAPLDSLLDWQWGGWIQYYVFHFDDGVQSQRVLQAPSASVWTRLSLDEGAHEFFARITLEYNYFNPGDEFTRQQDWIGPDFDRAWYEIDLGKALHIPDWSGRSQTTVRIGRQEVQLGTGYALDMPMDAVWLTQRLGDVRLNGLIGRSITSTANIDRSAPVDSHMSRRFYGVQATYEGFNDHRPFAYALWNDDFTDERPQNAMQNYAYDTRYFGFGSRGSIVHNLNYWTEAVFEKGRSYGDGMFLRRSRVDAWAWDAGVEKLFDSPVKPRLFGEYMFASGDGDRIFSPTNADGGNSRGNDSSFVGFGFRDTGISAGLTPSNLHIWKAGASASPFHSTELLRDLEIGTNWLLYHKHHSHGAISDETADEFNGYVGWEMDYYINWRLSSDLSWTIRWGMFFPGEAFSDRSSRSFLLTGLTWSF